MINKEKGFWHGLCLKTYAKARGTCMQGVAWFAGTHKRVERVSIYPARDIEVPGVGEVRLVRTGDVDGARAMGERAPQPLRSVFQEGIAYRAVPRERKRSRGRTIPFCRSV